MKLKLDLDLETICNRFIESGMVKSFLEEAKPELIETVTDGDAKDAGQVIASVLKTLFVHYVGKILSEYAEEDFDEFLHTVGLVMEDRDCGLDNIKLKVISKRYVVN